MNWNDSLYWYWRERGGEFFASMVWKDSGILFLDMPMGPALIQCELVPGCGGMLHREIAITLRASMEHPYYLTVRRERFSGREDEEGGVFELAVRRNIRSSDPARTPYLLQNRRLQELLRAEPGAWVQINPIPRSAATSVPRASLAYPATAQTDSQAPRRCGGGKGGISHEG